MARTIALTVTAAAALAASLVATPAYAQAPPEFDITVTPDEARPGETATVSGDATDPTCAEDGVGVRFHYTKPDGSEATAVVTTTTDAAGHFEAEITVPSDAVAGEDASVNAFIADCTPPGGETSSRSSKTVSFDVLAHEGKFSISRTSGRPGDVVTFSGTNCWGGSVIVFFNGDVVEGEPEDDRTFSGEYVLPDYPDGVYEFGAECPGTDYNSFQFRLINPGEPSEEPRPAPPARPVRGRPTFTG